MPSHSGRRPWPDRERLEEIKADLSDELGEEPTNAGDFDLFGGSVAVDGDTPFIGAASDEDPNGSEAGSVYVFRE